MLCQWCIGDTKREREQNVMVFFLERAERDFGNWKTKKKKKKTLVDVSFLRPLDVIFAMCHSST